MGTAACLGRNSGAYVGALVEPLRSALLPSRLEHYNLERPHLGIGGRSPIERINNGAGHYNRAAPAGACTSAESGER
jgi:hypothetical protein